MSYEVSYTITGLRREHGKWEGTVTRFIKRAGGGFPRPVESKRFEGGDTPNDILRSVEGWIASGDRRSYASGSSHD